MTGFLSRVANGSQYTVTIGRQIDGVYQCHVKNILGERTSSVRFSFWCKWLNHAVFLSLSISLGTSEPYSSLPCGFNSRGQPWVRGLLSIELKTLKEPFC